MSPRSFFDELKRRHVMRVTGVYVVAAYAVVQGAATVFPLLGFSNAAATAVLIVAILGLPVAILLAWMFDITPEGVRRTQANDGDEAGVVPLEQQLEVHRRRFAARAVGFVGVGVLVALVGFAAYGKVGTVRGAAAEQITAIAVLPFENYSTGQDQEFFTDGVSEEILNRLAQVEGLTVPGRTSSWTYKGVKADHNEIRQKLGVQAVLEGSVRREGQNVRITSRLTDTRTGNVIWADSYDRNASSVFAVQDEIANAIIEAVKLKIASSAPVLNKEERSTDNAQAQDLYFKGLKAWNARTDEQLRIALQYFEKAAEADTTYALAFAGLAKTYAVLPSFGQYPVVEALRKGSAAAARAIALDPGLGDAHAALGQIAQNLEWDLPSALRSYRRAVRFNDSDPAAHQWYAEALMLSGDFDAAAVEIDRAIELDRLSPSARSVRAYLTMLRGDAIGALSMYANLTRESPDYRLGQLNYALVGLVAKDYGAAAQGLIAALPEHAPDVGTLIAAASGQSASADATRAIDGLQSSAPASIVTLLYAAIGAHDRAMAMLKTSFDAGSDANFPYVVAHPLLKPLHNRPAYQQIVRTLGITIPA